MGLNADKRHRGGSRMGVGLRRAPPHLFYISSEPLLQLSISSWPLSRFLWKFEIVKKRRGVIWLKKQDGERTGTRSDRQREKENKGAGGTRGAEWRWLNGGGGIVMNRW